MRMNDAFPSKYLKAEDLEEGDLIVTIREAVFEEFTDQTTKRPDNKPVLYFEGKDTKPLVLNKTNYKTISQLVSSDDTDEWAGRRIALYATEVESFGEMRLGIRVRLKTPAAKAAAATSKPPVVSTQVRKAQSAPTDPYGESLADDPAPF